MAMLAMLSANRPFLACLIGSCLVACSSSSSDGNTGTGSSASKTVKDKLGRTCTISQAAGPITCDQPPQPAAACKSGTTACFTLGTTSDVGGPAAVCAGCCTSDTATSVRTDCSEIPCATPADCPANFARCVTEGVCRK